MGRPRTEEILDAMNVSPERQLIAAMIRQAVTDARRRPPNADTFAARAWLDDEPLIRWWLDVLNLPDMTYTRLRSAAGLEAPHAP
jgi:hypothetical protein